MVSVCQWILKPPLLAAIDADQSKLHISADDSRRSGWVEGSAKIVRSHGWRSRAYRDVFTAYFGRAFHPAACRLTRLPVAECHGFWESGRI